MELASLVALGGGGKVQQALALREYGDELAPALHAVAPDARLASARQPVAAGDGAASVAERGAPDRPPAHFGLARHAAWPRAAMRRHVGRRGGDDLLPGRVLLVALRHAGELGVVPERDRLDVVRHQSLVVADELTRGRDLRIDARVPGALGYASVG